MEIQQQADQASADEFFESVARLGASPAPGATYRGTTTPVPLVCAVGHACTATPSSLQRGQEICDTCAGPGPRPGETDRAEAEAADATTSTQGRPDDHR